MKRIVFCFDGTWESLNNQIPTNVVITAQCILPSANDGTVQIVHYDPGVGTTKQLYWRGGILGKGLLEVIIEAYSFLIFNYAVGDQIFVFGFSRGAFTARSFIGLLRCVGILRRARVQDVQTVVKRYRDREPNESPDSNELLEFRFQHSPEVCVNQTEEDWRVKNKAETRGSAPILRIRYLGIWETVGSLGIPLTNPIARFLDRKFAFHDESITNMVTSARHAVAIDERHIGFNHPTLWDNFDALNTDLGFAFDAEDAPYQQKWFPGVHGSVGGGGIHRGLSDGALDWVLSGARLAGLELDVSADSPIFELHPNVLDPLDNNEGVSNLTTLAMRFLLGKERMPGPARLSDLHPSTIQRWHAPANAFPVPGLYRPPTLNGVANALNTLHVDAEAAPANAPVVHPGAAPQPGSYYTVVRGDNLYSLAERAYGNPAKRQDIFVANELILGGDPNRIYEGQILFIPFLSAPANPVGGVG